MEHFCVVIEHHWAPAWAIGIALLMIIDAFQGNEPHPRSRRRKKPLMMIALARIGFCLTSVVWRESMHIVSHDTHRHGREKKKTRYGHE
jgi:hypothetical protein